ncbi:protein BASIC PENTACYSTEINE2-like [Bidens hawaiensis]|uniref:protein BASIC PENTACYSTEINE2-like n=1 Tax=Bidens hawaiensis TaxID=980011 RepID=UPI0040496DCF
MLLLCYLYFQMDDDGLMRNWGYYEPSSFKEPLGLQLMSPMLDHRESKPILSPRENPIMMNPNGLPYHHPVSEPPVPMHYRRDGWVQRERILHMLPANPNFSFIPDHSPSSSMLMLPPVDSSKEMAVEDYTPDGDDGSGSQMKKRTAAAMASPKAKKPKKARSLPRETGNTSSYRSKSMKRNMDVVIHGIDMDISGIPIPVCSCTGVPQQCYRWGCGGWQSACCTTTISMYPLPMSTKRRGARIAGRKMSQGACKKVLEKLASEGYNFANAIDLRTHWAKHGTNKFVTIR